MQKYEYRMLWIGDGETDDHQAINDIAKEGYRLVSSTLMGDGVLLIFERAVNAA